MIVSWVTFIWLMIASACLTLAGMYFLVWFRNRGDRAHLFFAINAISMTAFSFGELWMMRVATTDEAVVAFRFAHVGLVGWLLSNVWFVKTYLRSGRAWLAWTIVVVRLGVMPFNFLPGQNLTFREITALDHVQFLGETVVALRGHVNPWQVVTQVVVILIMVFIADASLTAWRRGDRRKALVVGGSVEFCIVAAFVMAAPVTWGLIRAPYIFSLPYVGLVLVMAYELSRDVLRASQLVRDLQLSEAGLRENQARLEASNQQISLLFGRLIAAQETERTRIARDLHDDIGQRIAGLAIAMSSLKRKLSAGLEGGALDTLASMQRDTAALADEVRQVSHELHPTLLKHAGLVEALRGVCTQFQKRHGIAVAYRADATLDALPHDVALALYRVAQEALYNVSKHAGASHIEIALTQTPAGVELSIADDGKGFNLTDSRAGGLGLLSMDERVRFLRGHFAIQTTPGGGTRLQVQIPVALEAWPQAVPAKSEHGAQ